MSEEKPQKTLLQHFTHHLWSVISLLREHLESPELRDAVLKEHGLESVPTPSPADPSDVTAIEAFLEADNPDVLAFLEATESLVRVVDAIEGLLTPILAGNSSTLDVRDLTYALLESAAIPYLRYNVPLLYAGARAAGVLDHPSTYEGLHFIHDLLLSFRAWTPETEAEARKFSNTLFLGKVVASLGFALLREGKRLEATSFLDPFRTLAGWDCVEPPFGQELPILDSISSRALTWEISENLRHPDQPQEQVALTTTVILIPKVHGGPGLFVSLGGNYAFEWPPPDVLNAVNRFKLKAELPQALSFFLAANPTPPEGSLSGGLELEFTRTGDGSGGPAFVLPRRSATRLEGGGLGLRGKVSREEFFVEGNLVKGVLVVATEDPDSFFASFLPPEGLRATFDLSVGYDALDQRLYFGGSTKLELVIPIGKTLGPLSLWQIGLALSFSQSEPSAPGEPRKNTFELLLTASLSLELFAITATVDRIGVAMRLAATPGRRGRLGLTDTPEFDFVPPRGLGLAVDAKCVKGGGFIYFDPENKRYAGVLELEIKGGLSLKVVGLIQTGLDARPGFSLLLIGSVEGLEWNIFAGGKITGIGVILGMHRTLSVPAFQAGVKNGAIDAVLFPKDPLKNAPALLQALSTLFPVATGQWIVGVSVQAAWLNVNMVKLELGILVEFSSPTRIALLGQVELGLPSRALGLVSIHFDVVGILHFEEKCLSVDASLRDSTIAGFPLTGDLAVRARWGANRSFAAAIGGLHPRFALPDGFPSLDRVAITIGKGNNPRIRGRTYIGITPNTLQFGLGAELYVGAGGFSIEGDFGIDVIFEFDPFRFSGDLLFDASVKYQGRTLAGLRVTGTLEGPGPWNARGSVSIKLLFIKVSKHFDESWGDDRAFVVQPGLVLSTLVQALASKDSWRSQLSSAASSIVSLRPAPAPDSVEIHPLGALEVVQRVVPLGIELERYNGGRIEGQRSFSIGAARVSGVAVEQLEPVREQFSPGQFLDIGKGDEAVTRPSFEPFQAGVRLASPAPVLGAGLSTNFEYEEIVINEYMRKPSFRRPQRITAEVQLAGAERGAAAAALRTQSGRYSAQRPRIKVGEAGFVAVSPTTNHEQPVATSLPPAATYTEVLQALRRSPPQPRGELPIVVRKHERAVP